MSEQIIVVETDEIFCDCCHAMWKTRVMTEIASTGLLICPACMDHQGVEYCPIWSGTFRDELFAAIELLRTKERASEEETVILEDILDSIDCYLSFFRKDEDHGLCEFDSII